MIKKSLVFLIAAAMLVLYLPTSLAARVSFSAILNRESMELMVSGSCSDNSLITLWVSDADVPASEVKASDLYAMQEIYTDGNGNFQVAVPLPASLEYGEYKVVIGGLGTSIPESERCVFFNYEDLENFSLWLEAENAVLTGNYTKNSYASEASGGSLVSVDTPNTETENSVRFDFSVPADSNYDIWVLGTLGNATYVTNYLYYIDNEIPQNNTRPGLERVYTTNDVRKAPIYWTKLDEAYISEGDHTLTFTANDLRSFGDYIYQVLDTVVIVPKEWKWNPHGFHRTYNANTIKLNCVYAEKEVDTIERGGIMQVYLETKLKEETDHDVTVWAALTKNGELVSSTVKDTRVVTSRQTVGKGYETSININVPSFAPDGTYEVVCGMSGAMQSGFYQNESNLPLTEDGFVRLGSVHIGSAVVAEPGTVEFDNVELEVDGDNINAEYRLQASNLTRNEKAFVKLWKGDVLWGVAQTDSEVDTNDTQSVHSVTLKLPIGIPVDSYTAEFGFCNANGTANAGTIQTTISGKYGYKPLSNGVYTSKKTGRDHFWYVTQENTLIWDGEPYIPIGGMECLKLVDAYSGSMADNENYWTEDKAELDMLIENGVTDLYINANTALNVPFWVWEYIFDYLEQNGVRYGLQPNSAQKNNMDVFYIRSNPDVSIEVTDVKSSGIVTKEVTLSDIEKYGKLLPLSGCYALVNQSGAAIETGECNFEKIGGGYRFSADITLPSAGTYKVVFTPKVNKDNSIICNFWDYPQENSEHMKAFSEKTIMGDNFRCIIDPLNNESGYYNSVESIRPYSTKYNAIYAKWLKDKYTTIAKLNRAWGTSGISDFTTASRLIPVYTAANNQSDYNVYATDPDTYSMYTLSGRKGVMWTDYLIFRDEMTADYYNSVSDAFKTATDAPIIIKNVWGHKEYFINKTQKGGFDGLGVEAYGSVERIKLLQASSYGMAHQFEKTAWLIVTETETDENISAKYASGEYGYGTEQNMKDHFDELIKYGAKGIFDFLYSSRSTMQIQTAYSYISNPEMFEWANHYRESLDFEEIAKYIPTEDKVYMLPHKSNYYTYPNRYTAVLYNDDYNAPKQAIVYDNMMIMPIEDADTEAELVVANFPNGPASTSQGKKFGEMLNNMAGDKQAVYLGFRKDLGTVPQLDKYFTNSYTTNSAGVRVQVLKPTATSKIIRTAPNGSPWAIRDGNLWIISAEDVIDDNSIRYLKDLNVFMNGADLEWRDVEIRKSNGSVPTKLAEGEYTVKAQVKNNTSNLYNAAVMVATYSNGILTGVAIDENRIYSGLNELKSTITAADSDTELKVFVWDGVNAMKPIMTIPGLKN